MPLDLFSNMSANVNGVQPFCQAAHFCDGLSEVIRNMLLAALRGQP